jgi:hypothetical protein
MSSSYEYRRARGAVICDRILARARAVAPRPSAPVIFAALETIQCQKLYCLWLRIR